VWRICPTGLSSLGVFRGAPESPWQIQTSFLQVLAKGGFLGQPRPTCPGSTTRSLGPEPSMTILVGVIRAVLDATWWIYWACFTDGRSTEKGLLQLPDHI
jgi:hypothetical protein